MGLLMKNLSIFRNIPFNVFSPIRTTQYRIEGNNQQSQKKMLAIAFHMGIRQNGKMLHKCRS